ncbi:MAG: N-acetylneuraminate synthase family protein [Bryobacterales bacterium]|nr:N-acetylneuraminate synthase family protein [Bryobacterales bacterium]
MFYRTGSGPCLIIGEVAQAHDGSLGMAHAFIDAIANAGAGAVKFQTHIAAAESTPGEPWRVKFSRQDATRYEYWQRMEFTEAQWLGLRQHADERGIAFLSSPFSMEAALLLERVGVPKWKVASGEFSNTPMLDFMASTGKPVLLSCGMSRLEEIDATVARFRSRQTDITVMQCTSAYPCPPEKIGLNMLDEFRRRYGCAVGLSDHSGTIYPSLAAAALGVDVIEVHVTMSREAFGPDVSSSITTAELRQLVDGVQFIENMMAHPLDKDAQAAEMAAMRTLFTKSVVVTQSLPAGTILEAGHLGLRKPGTGIPADRLPDLIGARLNCSVTAGEMLSEEHVCVAAAAAA